MFQNFYYYSNKLYKQANNRDMIEYKNNFIINKKLSNHKHMKIKQNSKLNVLFLKFYSPLLIIKNKQTRNFEKIENL